MVEFFNMLVSLWHYLSFEWLPGRNGSYAVELSKAVLLDKNIHTAVVGKMRDKISHLTLEDGMEPCYVFFKHRKQPWYKVILLDRDKKFICRLNDVEIAGLESVDYYFNL